MIVVILVLSSSNDGTLIFPKALFSIVGLQFLWVCARSTPLSTFYTQTQMLNEVKQPNTTGALDIEIVYFIQFKILWCKYFDILFKFFFEFSFLNKLNFLNHSFLPFILGKNL